MATGIKLTGRDSFHPDVHGFFRTAEGRAFLRELYPSYREREAFGERKIITLIADVSHLDQSAEYDITRAALRRWSKGQGELWKDADKSLRVMERLEYHMMQVPAIYAVLSDQAAEIRKHDIGYSLAVLIYGSTMIGDKSGPVSQLLARQSGLFEVQPIVEHLDGTSVSTPYRYAYYQRPKNAMFLLTQHFSRRELISSAHEMNDRWTGFAFPLPSGEIFHFLIDYANPSVRIFEMAVPVDLSYDRVSQYLAGGVSHDVVQSIFSFQGYKYAKFSWGDPRRLVNYSKPISRIGSLTSKILDNLSWDIPL